MRIGFICVPISGHLNPMIAMARKLQSRGHDVLFFGFLDAECAVRVAGLDFIPFGEKEYPLGVTQAIYVHLATPIGEDFSRIAFQDVYPRRCQTTLEQLPPKLFATGIEALVIDKSHHFTELVALSLNIPYAIIWTSLPYDGSGATPPFNFAWPHERSPEAIARNLEGVKKMEIAFAPTCKVAKTWAKKNNLEINWDAPHAAGSRFAIISQVPKEFDFEGCPQPEGFHYTGPFHDNAAREPCFFPWNQLTGEPLVYASMGTLVNRQEDVYRTIIQSISQISGIQLVLSVGHNLRIADLGRFPSSAIVVPYAPQIELLSLASVCITHAGLNTVLESLAAGCPMVAVPLAADEPGIAARIRHHGVGEMIPKEILTVHTLSAALRMVLGSPSYRHKAQYFQEVIAKTCGLNLAADIIERDCLRGNRP